MSRKKLRNQLENLLADLGQDASLLPSSPQEGMPSGWTWECDPQGNIRACSSEVESCLGRKPQEFLEQPLQTFALDKTSADQVAQVIQAAVAARQFPTTIQVHYLNQTSEPVPATIHIFPILTEGENLDKAASPQSLTGLRGFTRLVRPAGEQPANRPLISGQAVTLKKGRRKPKPPAGGVILAGGEMGLAVRPQGDRQGLERGGEGPGEQAHIAPIPVYSEPARGEQARMDVLGLLEIVDDTPGRTWTGDEKRLVEQVADQLSLALENARLFQAEKRRLAETESLYLASAEINTAQSYEDILTALRRHTLVGDGSHHASLILFDEPWVKNKKPAWAEVLTRWTNGMIAGSSQDVFLPRYPLSEFSSAAMLLRPDAPLLVQDILHDPRLDEKARAFFTKRFQARSTLFCPLVVSGQWIGFLNACYPVRRNFPEPDIRRMMALVNQAAIAVQNLRSIDLAEQRAQEAQQRSDELAIINRVVSELVSSTDLRQVLDTLAAELVSVFDLGQVGIALREGDHLTVVAEKFNSAGKPRPSAIGSRIPIQGNPSTEQVIATRRPLVIQDAQNDPLLAPVHELMYMRQVQTIVIVPIITGGEVVGTVGMDIVPLPGAEDSDAEGRRDFTGHELALAETLIGQVSTAIQNANLFKQIQSALAETETLYQASAELNAAQSNDEILGILRSATLLGHTATSNVSVYLFDRPWTEDAQPDYWIRVARWSQTPYYADTEESNLPARSESRSPIRAWKDVRQLLWPDEPTIINELARLDRVGLAFLTGSAAGKQPRIEETSAEMGPPVDVERLEAQSLVLVPLVVAGQWIGHIIAAYSSPITASEAEIRRLESLAGQAAVALQNLRLYGETRRRAAQLETAAEIARDTSGTLALEVLLKRAVNSIRDRYGFYHASIFLLDEAGSNAVVRESTGEAGEEMKRRGHNLPVGSRSVIGNVTATGKPLVINDVTRNSGTAAYRPNPLLPETQAETGIPLKIGMRVIGALDVQSTQANAFSEDDIHVLQSLADQIAVAVDNARSYELAQQAIEASRQRVQELSVLFNVSQALASAPMKSNEIANVIAQRFIEVMGVPECSISLVDREKREVITLADMGHSRGEAGILQFTNRIGNVAHLEDYPATRHVLETLLPLVTQADDVYADQTELSYMQENGLATLAVIPMAVKGQAIGIIELEARDQPHTFTSEQLNLALILANAAAVAMENARLYEEQRQLADKLRELDRLKSQFLANMSHELRTPLNSIIGFSRVIIKGIDGPVTDLQLQDLNAIYNSGQHLLNLINAVLDISKIEAGKMELNFEEEVNLAEVINSVSATATGLLKDKPIQIVRNVPADLPRVRADVTRLRQVLINFFSNASKFTEGGTITIEARVQDAPDGASAKAGGASTSASPGGQREVIVKVTDTGIGISPDDQKRLFQPFSQVDDSPTRKTGGSGLGLSISRLLIELHGGRIGVESHVGKGSTFYFTLPLPETEPKVGPITQPPSVILAIDDENQVLSLYERYLSKHGYQVIPFNDPEQAVKQARQLQPCAVLLDVKTHPQNGEAGKDGWKALQELKSDPETRQIPVIICTILDGAQNQEKGYRLGASDYLVKPILEDDLVMALERTK